MSGHEAAFANGHAARPFGPSRHAGSHARGCPRGVPVPFADLWSLGRVGLFAGLPAPELAELAGRLRIRIIAGGQQVVGQEERDDGAVFFLLAGRARVTVIARDGRSVTLHELGPGEMFGDLAAVDGAPRSASVEAVTALRVAVMERSDFVDLITHSPALSLNMLRLLAGRTRAQNERLFEQRTLGLGQRLAAELVRRAQPGRGDRSAVISPAPRQLDLADLLGARRESVTREWARLRRDGLVRRAADRLIVTDLPALARRAREGTS